MRPCGRHSPQPVRRFSEVDRPSKTGRHSRLMASTYTFKPLDGFRPLRGHRAARVSNDSMTVRPCVLQRESRRCASGDGDYIGPGAVGTSRIGSEKGQKKFRATTATRCGGPDLGSAATYPG